MVVSVFKKVLLSEPPFPKFQNVTFGARLTSIWSKENSENETSDFNNNFEQRNGHFKVRFASKYEESGEHIF